MPNLAAPFDATGWMFAAGPADMVRPTQTTDCFDVVEHRLVDVADALLSFPGVRLTHAAEPSWAGWQADWRDSDPRLALGMIPFYADVWVNTTLSGRCTVGQLLAMWAHLLSRQRGIWLFHARVSEVLDTPASFIELCAV